MVKCSFGLTEKENTTGWVFFFQNMEPRLLEILHCESEKQKSEKPDPFPCRVMQAKEFNSTVRCVMSAHQILYFGWSKGNWSPHVVSAKNFRSCLSLTWNFNLLDLAAGVESSLFPSPCGSEIQRHQRALWRRSERHRLSQARGEGRERHNIFAGLAFKVPHGVWRRGYPLSTFPVIWTSGLFRQAVQAEGLDVKNVSFQFMRPCQ